MLGRTLGTRIVQGNRYRVEFFEERRSLRFTSWYRGKCIGFYDTSDAAALAILENLEFAL